MEPTITRQTKGQFLVQSKSQPGLQHVVQVRPGGIICDCDAALWGKHCWHVAVVSEIVNTEMKWEKARENAMTESRRRELTTIAQGAALLMGEA